MYYTVPVVGKVHWIGVNDRRKRPLRIFGLWIGAYRTIRTLLLTIKPLWLIPLRIGLQETTLSVLRSCLMEELWIT
jgi:hypothetical protein